MATSQKDCLNDPILDPPTLTCSFLSKNMRLPLSLCSSLIGRGGLRDMVEVRHFMKIRGIEFDTHVAFGTAHVRGNNIVMPMFVDM